MFNAKDFREGTEFGAKGVIDLLETRLYYMPSTWREGNGGYIIDIIENTLKAAKRIYIEEGFELEEVDYGKV